MVLGSARTPEGAVPRAIGPRAESRGGVVPERSRGVLGHRVGMVLRWSSTPLGHWVGRCPVVLDSARTPVEEVRTPGGGGPRAIGPRAVVPERSRGGRGEGCSDTGIGMVGNTMNRIGSFLSLASKTADTRDLILHISKFTLDSGTF